MLAIEYDHELLPFASVLKTYIPKVHVNVVLQSAYIFPKWPFSMRLPHLVLVTCPANVIS